MILSTREETGRVRKSDYLKYPTVPRPQFVIQWHLRGKGIDDLTEEEKKALEKAHFKEILDPKDKVRSAIEKTAGCSNHQDFRVQLTDRTLVGWTIVGLRWGIVGKDITKDDLGIHAKTTKKKGFRAEMKATQPSVWLNVKGYVPKGKVGATAHHGGFFIIMAKGDVVYGALKPYFKEYFVKDPYCFKDWTRIVVRGVKAQKIDPECIAEDSLVITSSGFKLAKDVQIGDEVLGVDGKWHKVSDVYPIEDDEQYEIHVFGSIPFVVNGKHPILINQLPDYLLKHHSSYKNKRRRTELNPVLVPARNLRKGDIVLFAKPQFETKYHSSYFDGFLLGLYLGDGLAQTNNPAIVLNGRTEYRLALLVKRIAEEKFEWAHLHEYKDGAEIRVSFPKQAWKFFGQVVKDGKKFVPTEFLYYNNAFLRGLIDGFSCADRGGYSHGRCIVNRNLQVISMLSLILLKLGRIPSFKISREKDGITYSVYWKEDYKEGGKFCKFYDYGNYIGFRVRQVKKVNSPKRLINIEVEDGYFAVPFVTTHNTKKPLKGQYELIWRVMIPETQKPYAITKRAMSKGWFPPKDIIPFPLEWAKKHWKDEVDKWFEWVQEKWKEKPRGQMKLSKKIKWALFMHSWMGQVVIRGIPNYEFYLRIDDGKKKILSFYFEKNPLRLTSVSSVFEGRVDKKWLTFEGDLPPNSPYNPTKKLTVHVIKLDEGDGELDVETIDGTKVLKLKLNGQHMKGHYLLIQEEKGSDIFVLEKVQRLAKGYFKLFKVQSPKATFMELLIDAFPTKPYLRVVIGASDLKSGSTCLVDWVKDRSLFEREGEIIIDSKPFRYSVVDEGEVETHEVSDFFISFTLVGSKIDKTFALSKINALWTLEEYKGAEVEMQEDPLEGMQFRKFKVEDFPRKGYKIMWIYDPRYFTRAEPSWQDYLELKLPEGILDVLLGVYPVVGTIHHVRVMGIKYDPEKISDEEVEKFIKKNKLDRFVSPLIRRKREIEI